MSDRCPTCGGRYVTWTPGRIVEACQAWARQHGVPPAAGDWEKSTPLHPAMSTVVRHFGTWNAMIRASGFEPRGRGGSSRKRFTRDQIIAAIYRWKFDHGRLPTIRDWYHPHPDRPSRHHVIRAFGSWSAAMVAAGYEPTRKFRSTEGYRKQAAAQLRTRSADGAFAEAAA